MSTLLAMIYLGFFLLVRGASTSYGHLVGYDQLNSWCHGQEQRSHTPTMTGDGPKTTHKLVLGMVYDWVYHKIPRK